MNNNIKPYLIFSCLLMVLTTALAQTKDELRSYSNFVESTSVEKAYYHIYDPPFIVKPSLKKISEVQNRYPEELMISKISERNIAWAELNTLDTWTKPPEFFEEKVARNNTSLYLELLSKLEFTTNGVHYAYIKFRINVEGIDEPPIGIYLLQQKDGRWYYIQDSLNPNLGMVIALTKPEVLENLLKSKKGVNPYIDELIKESIVDGYIDLFALAINVLDKHYEESKSGSTKFMGYFFDDLNWTKK